MAHRLREINRASPTRERSSTASEQTARTVGLACTMSTLKPAASDGMMPIANVCQLCGPSQGSVLAVMTPTFSTSPFQHSGDAGQRAPAPGTAAAGQLLVVVAIPYVPSGPAAPDGPFAAVLPPGASRCAPMITAVTTIRTRPPPAVAASAIGRQRRDEAAACVPRRPGSPDDVGSTDGPVGGPFALRAGGNVLAMLRPPISACEIGAVDGVS